MLSVTIEFVRMSVDIYKYDGFQNINGNADGLYGRPYSQRDSKFCRLQEAVETEKGCTFGSSSTVDSKHI